MTTEQEDAAILHIVKGLRASKQCVVLLEFELAGMSKALRTAAETISGLTQGVATYPDLPADLLGMLAKIPPAAAVIDACAEYAAELARSKELKARLAALGL